MKGEQYKEWKPLPNLNVEFNFESLCENADGLKISLSDDSERVLIITFQQVIAYRSLLEECRESYFEHFNKVKKGFGSLWEVENSAWLSELAFKNDEDEAPIRHYLLLARDITIDVLTAEVPHIAWENNLFGDAV